MEMDVSLTRKLKSLDRDVLLLLTLGQFLRLAWLWFLPQLFA